jgi:hypothetical protein
MDTGSIIECVASLAFVATGIYASTAQYRPSPSAAVGKPGFPTMRACLNWLPPLLCICLVAFGYYEHRRKAPILDKQAISSYGFNQSQSRFYATAATDSLYDRSFGYKLILIVRAIHPGTEEMTDPDIAKSSLYTITGEDITMAAQITQQTPLKLSPKTTNTLAYYLAALPNGVSPDQITALSDIDLMHGKLLESHTQENVSAH